VSQMPKLRLAPFLSYLVIVAPFPSISALDLGYGLSKGEPPL